MGTDNMPQIVFTELAQEDLKAIRKYICCNNFSAAQEVVKHILECIENLNKNLAIGRAGRVLSTRELIISKYPYIVPYQVRGDYIYILRVMHSSRKW